MIESNTELAELVAKMSSAHTISQSDAQELIQSTWTCFTLMLESALDCLPRTSSKRKYRDMPVIGFSPMSDQIERVAVGTTDVMKIQVLLHDIHNANTVLQIQSHLK
jgi:hypothetical protein